jgi:hypothetical protein
VSVLAAQPVSVLAAQNLAAQDLVALLNRLGLRTLGDFAALPVRDVASRFGDAGEGAHRLARGLDSRPLATRPPPADLSVAQEFDPPEPRAEPVVFAAKALAGLLHDGLAARGLTCVRVQVTATWADGRESSRRWRHDGLLSAAAVADRVRWQLDGGPPASPDDGAAQAPPDDGEQYQQGGIVALRLVPDQVVRATGQQLALWGETLVSDRVARAAMRVQAMLGHEAVLRPVLGGGWNVRLTRVPVPFGEKLSPACPRTDWPGGSGYGARPGLLPPPARGSDDAPVGPVTVSGPLRVSAAPARLAVRGEPPQRVTGWAGPWPLSERWWDPSAARRRARFQLATEDGRAWLAVLQNGRWLVEAGYWLGGLGQPTALLAGAAAPDVLGDRSRAPSRRAQPPRPDHAVSASRSEGGAVGRTALPLLNSFLDGAAPRFAEAASARAQVLALPTSGMYGVPVRPGGRPARRPGGPKLTRCSAPAPRPPANPGQPRTQSVVPAGLARDPEGYRRLCAVISAAQLAGGEKGRPVYDTEALADAHGGHWVVLTGCRKGAVPAALANGGPEAAWRELAVLAGMFGHENVMVELTCQHDPGDDERNDMLARLAALADLGVVATGNVHFAAPAQARLGQALAAGARSHELATWTAGCPRRAPPTCAQARR